MIRSAAAIAATLACTAVLGGCRDGSDDAPPPRPAPAPQTTARPPAPALRPARCPAGVARCASVTGRIIYVEAVDPDGDGDAHFVVLGGSVTAPGFTAIDVRSDLRPKPLPGRGAVVTAAGPVQTGSYGQRQIHALELRVAP